VTARHPLLMENLAQEMIPRTRGATSTAVRWTVVGAFGPTRAHAVPLVEEEARGKQGSVTAQHLLVGEDNALGLQIKQLIATLSAVLSMVDGARGQTMEAAVRRVEEARRREPGLAQTQELLVVVQLVLEPLHKMPAATLSAVLSTVVGAPGLTMVPAAKVVEEG